MLRKTTAFGTAIALAGLIGVGLGAAVPAAAAPGERQDFDAYAQELLSRPGIEGVAQNSQGKTVVYTSPRVQRSLSVPSGVEIKKLPEPISTYAATDIVGGAGFLSRVGVSAYSCSIGFSAWNSVGAPAVISAGHCDTAPGTGTQTYLSQPSTDPGAGQGGEGFVPASSPFGAFTFSQFGGPGGSVGQEDANSTDIAVIDVSAGTPKPAVTDWTTAATDDLSLSTTPITAVGTVKQGQPISKSGRTTGLTTSVNSSYDLGWFTVSGKTVYGFANEGLRVRSGDSGGAVFQGQTAVGVVSGGIASIDFSITTDLVSALKLTPGYTVMLALPTPTITTGSGAEVPSNGALTGTASPGATVVVTVNGSAVEVVADASGRWSLSTGSALGRVDFTVQERDGFNRSEAAVGSATIVLAPVGFDPLDGLVHSAPTVITGTGFPGATVNLTGDVVGTAVVAVDGSWSIPVTEELAFGAISISATQSVGAEVSPIATLSFEYAIEAPVIESPADGATFAVGSEPTVVTGRVVPGAEVTATLNGVALSATQATEPSARAGQATVAFSFDLPTVAVGSHKIVVTQVIAGESSDSTSTFDILAAPVVNPTGPAGVITPGDNLPATGSDPLLAVWAGALILLLGGGAVLAKRRFGQRNG